MEFIDYVINPIISNFIAIGSFIILTSQLIAILFGKKIIVPEESRPPTIWLAFFLIMFSLIYYLVPEESRPPTIWVASSLIMFSLIFYLIIQIKNLRKQLKDPKPKDPDDLIPFSDYLIYPDVKFAIYCLSKKIEESEFFGDKNASNNYNVKRNIIIGIDRGGAIVGGLLAKNLGVAVTTLAINWSNDNPKDRIPVVPDPSHRKETSIIFEKYLDNIDFRNVKNILLVDDAIRIGNAMIAAKKLVEAKLKKIDKVANFVCDETNPNRAGGHDEKVININIACILYVQQANEIIGLPEFCVYQTGDSKLWLLWDTTRPEMKMKTDEKNIFDEYYTRIPKGEIGRNNNTSMKQ